MGGNILRERQVKLEDKLSYENLKAKTDLIFFKFTVLFYLCVAIGTLIQFAVADNKDFVKILIFTLSVVLLLISVLGYFTFKSNFCMLSLALVSIYFTLLNLVCKEDWMLLVYIPICILGLLVSNKRIIYAQYMIWLLNALARICIHVNKSDISVMMLKDFMLIFFIFGISASAVKMVYKMIGVYYSQIINELSKENSMHKTLYELSKIDNTTRLLNRIAYNEFLNNFKGDVKNIGCIYVDVNGLHEYNNTYGHQAGDSMLYNAAEEMKRSFKNGVAYRIGGDEFVIISENTDFKVILNELRAFRKKMRDKHIYVATGLEWRDENLNLSDIVKAADEKMFLDKQRFYKEHDESLMDDRKTSIYM